MITNAKPLSSSLLLLVLISCFVVSSAVGVQQPKKADATSLGPVVEEWNPKIGSINSVIELRGYRLYPDALDRTTAFFVQNGIELPARTGGGTSITNDADHGAQSLEVIVPEEVVPGTGQIVVEVDGRRSVPVTVTITEWKLPVIKGITPVRGAPGTHVAIDCEGFHINDEIEITDSKGKQKRYNSGGSSDGTSLSIPKDAPEGILRIRIGNRKYGKGQYTESFTFVVTNDPLAPEVVTSFMKSVAPGQWLDVQVSDRGPLKHSERTEVAFKQAGREIIVALAKPFRPHVAVPAALSPGEVELQFRTWRGGQPSEWSRPVAFTLADKPVAPSISAIRVKEGTWVHLWPGPDRPQSFTVTSGDEVVLNGLWPVADAGDLKVSFVRAGAVVTLTAAELNENAEWFSDIRVRLPESLEPGKWRMIVSSETDGTHDEAPIDIHVVPSSSRR